MRQRVQHPAGPPVLGPYPATDIAVVAVLEPAERVGDLDAMQDVDVVAAPGSGAGGMSALAAGVRLATVVRLLAAGPHRRLSVRLLMGPDATRRVGSGPGDEIVGGHGVDDPSRWGSTPAAALSQPKGCHSSCPGAWASVSIATLHAPLAASFEQLLGRVLPLGPAVDLDRGVELGAGREHDLGVEL